MRMTRNLLIGLGAAFLMTSCDPFTLLEPRPDYRTQRQPRPQPRPGGEGEPDARPMPQPRPTPDNRPVQERYPVGERTDNPNFVISPYAPFNVVNVEGFSPGQLVRDPITKEIFRIP